MSDTPYENQHTPGDWAVAEDPEKELIIIGVPGRCVCVLFKRNDETDHTQTLANAHLLAAAPKLLEAASAILRHEEQRKAYFNVFKGNTSDNVDWKNEDARWEAYQETLVKAFDLARAAIAQAKAETPDHA